MRRGVLWAGLALGAPCLLLLVALPVGFVMELGKQVRLRVVNRSGRPLRFTLVGAPRDPQAPPRVAALTLHPFLPLPAFRAVDLTLEPGASRVLYYSGRQVAPRVLALSEGSELALPPAAAKRDVESGREVVIEPATPLLPIATATREAVERHTQAYPWAVLLAGPIGAFAFFRCRRSLLKR